MSPKLHLHFVEVVGLSETPSAVRGLLRIGAQKPKTHLRQRPLHLLPGEEYAGLSPTGMEFTVVNAAQLRSLRSLSLFLVLPGLLGLIVSATISVHYLDTLPKLPHPEELRMTARNIHGTIVYQTAEEDRQLSLMEDSSVGVFLVGLGLGLVYLWKWGIVDAIGAGEDDLAREESNS